MKATRSLLIFMMYQEYMKLHKSKLARNYIGIYLFEVKSIADNGEEQTQYFIVDFNEMKVIC